MSQEILNWLYERKRYHQFFGDHSSPKFDVTDEYLKDRIQETERSLEKEKEQKEKNALKDIGEQIKDLQVAVLNLHWVTIPEGWKGYFNRDKFYEAINKIEESLEDKE